MATTDNKHVTQNKHIKENNNISNGDLLAEVQEAFRQLAHVKNFSRVGGKLKVISVSPPNTLLLELLVEEEHVNGKSTLHGGQTAALVDIATARAVGMTIRDVPMVSMDISVSYMLPVKTGEVITIEAECLKIGRNMAFCEATFRRKTDGKIVAKGKHNIAFLHHLRHNGTGTPINQF